MGALCKSSCHMVQLNVVLLACVTTVRVMLVAHGPATWMHIFSGQPAYLALSSCSEHAEAVIFLLELFQAIEKALTIQLPFTEGRSARQEVVGQHTNLCICLQLLWEEVKLVFQLFLSAVHFQLLTKMRGQ